MPYTAFLGERILVRGDLTAISERLRDVSEPGVLVLDDATGAVVDVDVRSTAAARAPSVAPAPQSAVRRGRPKLGVVAREVTLLPRHWAWLSTQPGGASAALRRLVEQARKDSADLDLRRQRQEATYRAATVLAGDRPAYEEAMRALFAGDQAVFEQLIAAWPPDIAGYLRELGSA
jgi:hypothetical protein